MAMVESEHRATSNPESRKPVVIMNRGRIGSPVERLFDLPGRRSDFALRWIRPIARLSEW